MKTLFLLLSGLVLGLWTSCSGIVIPNYWKCFKDIIDKFSKEQISFNAAFAFSPNYILKGNRKNNNSKIKVVFDACYF
tara:strand:+ start:263 stop:496 length:234 start_codon:yes stop_codon:yes gene_type:complete